MLHAPSTLYLPETNEAGFRFTFNRRSYPPRPLITTTTPMVTVEMVEGGGGSSSPSSPVTTTKDKNLLSPPCRRSFRPKGTPKVVALPPRPFSAPPGRTFGIVDSPDRSSFRPRTPGPVASRSTPTSPELVRPPTTLCRSIVTCVHLQRKVA